MEKIQTAVEWLVDKLSITFQTMYSKEIQQAKEMEEEQKESMFKIMDAYVDDVMGGCTLRAKEWLKQFKNK